MSRYRYAIIVGASSGIGRQLVRQLAESGCRVCAVARRQDKLTELSEDYPERVIPVVHDVLDVDQVPELFQEVTGKLGGLDLVIYSAGVMPPVEPNEFNLDKDREMILVNDLGAVAWLNQAAMRFQNTGRGTIVGIGSVAGDRGRYAQPVYNASKAFLHTYLEALRNRLSKHGVKVVTIKPGPVETEMTMGLDIPKKMPVDKAAKLILNKSSRTGEHYLSPVHAIAFAIIRNIPSWIFRRLEI